jgi:hypothetical protein
MRLPRVRVTIRRLMILVLVLGYGFGWIVLRAHVQRDAVHAIRLAGGAVYYEWEMTRIPGRFSGDADDVRYLGLDGRPPWPEWLVDRLGPDYFGHVVTVVLEDGRANDAVMAQVGRLGGLEVLIIAAPDGDLSDAGVDHLRGLPRLRNFALGNGPCRVTGAVLADLAGASRLQMLLLDRVRLDDADLVQLKNCPDLRRLTLSRCEITGVGLGRVNKLASLKLLNLARSPISDAGLAYLDRFPKLEYVSVSGSAVTDGGIARLRAARPEMKITH